MSEELEKGIQLDNGKVILGKLIVSGTGDWRYVDIVPLEGGKYAGVLYA